MGTVTTIDVSRLPDLLRLAEEVRETKKPRMLTRDRETLAMLMPVGKPAQKPGKRKTTGANYEAFRAAAGGWKDVDTDLLLKNIFATRRQSNRPPVEL